MTSDTYIVNWNNIAKIWIEVDHTENMEKVLHSINKIWWDHEEMQSKTNGNVITVALKRIAGEFFKLMVDKDFGLEHLICRFIVTQLVISQLMVRKGFVSLVMKQLNLNMKK